MPATMRVTTVGIVGKTTDDHPENISVDLLHPQGRLHPRDIQDVMTTLGTLPPTVAFTTVIAAATIDQDHLH